MLLGISLITSFFNFLTFILCMCMHAFMLLYVCRGQGTTCGNQFSSSTTWIGGLSLDCQAWWQAPLYSELSRLTFIPFYCSFVFYYVNLNQLIHSWLNIWVVLIFWLVVAWLFLGTREHIFIFFSHGTDGRPKTPPYPWLTWWTGRPIVLACRNIYSLNQLHHQDFHHSVGNDWWKVDS